MVMSTSEAGSFFPLDDGEWGIIRPRAFILVALTAEAAERPPRKDLLEIT
jgi:hypothetical protein